MPMYTYRREDGTTFEIRQSFSDDALEVDPETGQMVQRVIHATGVIFKGSGYYVTDTRGANNPAGKNNGNGSSENGSKDSNNGSSETKAESNTEKKAAKTEAAAD